MHPYGILWPGSIEPLVRVEAGGTPAHLSRDRPPPSERACRAGTSRRAYLRAATALYSGRCTGLPVNRALLGSIYRSTRKPHFIRVDLPD